MHRNNDVRPCVDELAKLSRTCKAFFPSVLPSLDDFREARKTPPGVERIRLIGRRQS